MMTPEEIHVPTFLEKRRIYQGTPPARLDETCK
jgi:hypothetical protein